MEANKNSIYRLRQTTTIQKQNQEHMLVDTDSSYHTNSTCSRYNKYDTFDSEWTNPYKSDNSIVDSTNDKSIACTYKTRIKKYLNKSQINTGTSNRKSNINNIKLIKRQNKSKQNHPTKIRQASQERNLALKKRYTINTYEFTYR